MKPMNLILTRVEASLSVKSIKLGLNRLHDPHRLFPIWQMAAKLRLYFRNHLNRTDPS